MITAIAKIVNFCGIKMVIAFPGGSFEIFIEDPSGQGQHKRLWLSKWKKIMEK